RDLPAAPQERGVDAEDAAAGAAGEGDPGSLRRARDDGSEAPEAERRADAAVQGEGREPGERLRADAAHDADSLRVLLDAVGVDRAARPPARALDPRPLTAGPVLHHAGADGALDALAAADDAGGRSAAGEDHDDHAHHVPLLLPVGAERPRPLLAREQPPPPLPHSAPHP